jgi:hypothetical protein
MRAELAGWPYRQAKFALTEPVAAIDVLADTAIDGTLHSDGREAMLVRLVQVGMAAEPSLARAFRSCRDEQMRAAVFLALMALDLGPSLTDDDIRATAEDAEFYIKSREAVRAREVVAGES